ncbi:MAG TPA: recombinase family protein [Vicinamibacterales bacterium]|nr:recombinase family protein [Vicinamibacterales bacterium]
MATFCLGPVSPNHIQSGLQPVNHPGGPDAVGRRRGTPPGEAVNPEQQGREAALEHGTTFDAGGEAATVYFSHVYLREMAAKIRRGLAGQLERGFHTGSITYGYRTIPVPDPSGRVDPNGHPALLGKRREVNEREAVIVRRIFELYAAGKGIPSLVNQLNTEGIVGPRGGRWSFSVLHRLRRNERLTGRAIWGQRRFERRPGTRQKVARTLPRSEWRIVEHPELRIVSAELWNAVVERRRVVGAAAKQAGRPLLMRGRNAALHSRHLFSGFLRCGSCGAAVSVVSGGKGSPRYGCPRHSHNGATACPNRLTIRASLADSVLLAGLQAELLRPETLAYIMLMLLGLGFAARTARRRRQVARAGSHDGR